MDEVISMMSEPKVIAGTITKYYDLDVAAMDKATEEGKVVVLQFFANWCPKCKAQEPELTAAYNEIQREDVVGFRVHYKDDQTTKAHEDLARKYGVASQGTTVIIKNGKMVFKSPAHLNKNQFIAEIAKV
jgi:thiol-disulfide isomerase/thioredoxin